MAAYKHIAANNAGVQLQKGTTLLNKVVVNNTGTAWTISIYDDVAANVASLVAVLTALNGGNYDYECTLTQGLFVVTAGTTPGDCTIVFD